MEIRKLIKPVRAAIEHNSDKNWWRILLIWIGVMVVRYGIMVLLVATISSNQLRAQVPDCKQSLRGEKEILRYKVRWGFIRLGTVVLTQEPFNEQTVKMRMEVHSAEGLPFINVHFTNESIKNLDSPALFLETITSGRDTSERSVFLYESDLSKILMQDYADGKIRRSDSLQCDRACFDALGLLMLSRLLVFDQRSLTVPTLNDYSIGETELRFTGLTECVRTPAFNTAVRCRRVDGTANWIGKTFAGMQGPFTGYFSDNSAAVPIRAEVKIFLGSIVLELESFERAGWNQETTFVSVGDHR
jgi:hypothetical protein